MVIDGQLAFENREKTALTKTATGGSIRDGSTSSLRCRKAHKITRPVVSVSRESADIWVPWGRPEV